MAREMCCVLRLDMSAQPKEGGGQRHISLSQAREIHNLELL